ncbi:hypothetical protein BTUL_0063g00210 [Botrytis tulipae]|uniref:Uncharacterized protein n=1 Tax=Botrytis tulipae TaxID=87230 RepID=A0A4Z1ER21_9HELO|nr:hypothetical protein BTUL_0063g00210 [Botrytis tulipae]
MDASARQDSTTIGKTMGAYTTENSRPFATGGNFTGAILPDVEFLRRAEMIWKCYRRNSYETRDEDKKLFSQNPIQNSYILFSPPTPNRRDPREYFSHAALGNLIPEASLAISSTSKLQAQGSIMRRVLILLEIIEPALLQSRDSPQIDRECLSRSRSFDLESLFRYVRCIFKISSSLLFLSTIFNPSGKRNHGAVKTYAKKAALSVWYPTAHVR